MESVRPKSKNFCFNCNGGLGQFGDDAQRLYHAAFYVEDSEQRPADILGLAEVARLRTLALRGNWDAFADNSSV